MISLTFSDYFEAWENLLPVFLPFSVLVSTIWVVIFSSPLVFSWLYPIHRFQTKLNQNSAISVLSLKGWSKLYLFLLVYLLFSTVILVPCISLFLILAFELLITIRQWFYFSFFFPAIVYFGLIMRWHFKFRSPRYYLLDSGMGLRQFDNDIIIPYGAITALLIDTSHLRVAMTFQYRLVFPWTRKQKLYFQFFSEKELVEFKTRILEKVSLPFQEEKITPLLSKLFPITIKSPQLVNESSLNDLLPEKTLKILSTFNQSYQPPKESFLKLDAEKKPVANFCYSCGRPNTSETKFCIYCGTDLYLPLKTINAKDTQEPK